MGDFFTTATPYLLLGLAALGWLYRHERERRVAVEQQVSERKYKAYLLLIDVFFEATRKQRPGGSGLHPEQLEQTMADVHKELMLYASDEVLKLFQVWTLESRRGTIDMMRLGEFIVAIRRDMGNPKTKIQAEDVLRQIIRDYDDAKAKGILRRQLPPESD